MIRSPVLLCAAVVMRFSALSAAFLRNSAVKIFFSVLSTHN